MAADEAATLLHQYSEWLDGQGLTPDDGNDGRSHDDLVAAFLASRDPAALPLLRDEPYAWRLVKRPDSKTAQIELGDQYADFTDAQLTVLMHGIGRGLIQAGTIALQSRVGDDEDGWDD